MPIFEIFAAEVDASCAIADAAFRLTLAMIRD